MNMLRNLKMCSFLTYYVTLDKLISVETDPLEINMFY